MIVVHWFSLLIVTCRRWVEAWSDRDRSRVEVVAELFKQPVIRPEQPKGYLNLRIVRSKPWGERRGVA